MRYDPRIPLLVPETQLRQISQVHGWRDQAKGKENAVDGCGCGNRIWRGHSIQRILETTETGKGGWQFRATVFIVTKGDHLPSHKERMFSGPLAGSGKFAYPSVLITFKAV